VALTNLDVARGAFAVTPSDTVDLPQIANGLYVGTSAPGTLTVICQDGSTVLFGAVVAGLIPLSVKRVMATGTTVTNIVGLK
jgi:hypothetical protein